MAANSKIEWTDASWNPVVGCQKCSEGCRNCYAKTLHDQRHVAYHAGKRVPLQYAEPFETVQLMPDRLRDPLKWRKPKKVFVNSVSDLFHKDVPFEFIDHVFAVMASASQHTFQILTKRPERMAGFMKRVSDNGVFARDRYVEELKNYHLKNLHGYEEGFTLPSPPTGELRFIYDSACKQEAKDFNFVRNPKPLGHGFSGGEYHWRKWPLTNLWLGVSIENRSVLHRIDTLRTIPAAVRFLSVEPLLEDLGTIDLTGIHWVIVGGESGPGARPCRVEWIRDIVRQCKDAGVPRFVKQLGAKPQYTTMKSYGGQPNQLMSNGEPLCDRKGGDWNEWPADLRVREFPTVETAR